MTQTVVEVGDGEEVRRIVEGLHSRARRHVLLDDDARDGGVDVDDPVGVVLEVRHAEDAELLDGGIEVDEGRFLHLLGHFQVLPGDRPLLEEEPWRARAVLSPAPRCRRRSGKSE